ncbi:MAG: AMP-binding protein, partial [Proteobacteria bacterium]|nr:AMP-binding protein [Pseudomonadota bacterium]
MSQTLLSVAPDQRDALALVDERVEYSWNRLDPVLNRAANALSRAVDATRRAAVFAPNSAETVIAYVAGLEAGVSTVPVSYHLTAGELEYILRDSGASVLFVGPETAATGLEAARAA